MEHDESFLSGLKIIVEKRGAATAVTNVRDDGLRVFRSASKNFQKIAKTLTHPRALRVELDLLFDDLRQNGQAILNFQSLNLAVP